MDSIKDGLKKATGGGSGSGSGAQQQSSSGGQQNMDYVDKAFDAGSKKTGHNIDRDTQEKITDQGRGMFEKTTGKKVPDKVSN